MRRAAWTMLLTAAATLAFAGSANAAWVPLGPGAVDPTGVSSGQDLEAREAVDLKTVGGTLYAAWEEPGPPRRVRVARFADGGWQPVAMTGAPSDPTLGSASHSPELGDVGGVLWLTWVSTGSPNGSVLRAARYDASARAWVEPVSGEAPLNTRSVQGSNGQRLYGTGAAEVADVDGRPLVADLESGSIASHRLVRRLSDDGTAWETLPWTTGPTPSDVFHLEMDGRDGAAFIAQNFARPVSVSRLNPDRRSFSDAGAISSYGFGDVAVCDGMGFVSWSRDSNAQPVVTRFDATGGAGAAEPRHTRRRRGAVRPRSR